MPPSILMVGSALMIKRSTPVTVNRLSLRSSVGLAVTLNSGGALSWSNLKAQIDTHTTPFAFSWKWDGGGGHMMVVTGYKVIGAQNYVSINDPWSPNVGDQRDILYADYVDGSGYTHWTDYYDVTKK